MLINVVLFITLANLKQLIYYRIVYLMTVDIYKNIVLIFSLLKAVFFLFFFFLKLFCSNIYKIDDSYT